MTETSAFATRIREHFPEGLTGVFALGGTRMTYLLANHDQNHNPGQIDMEEYADYTLDLLQDLLCAFMELGGQNVIIPMLSYQLFNNSRGPEYAKVATELCYKLMSPKWIDFYRNFDIDPYFTGIDTLLHFPDSGLAYELGVRCREFNAQWQYKTGHRKLIWEVAPIPLFSFLRAPEVMGSSAYAELEARLAQCSDMQEMHDILYDFYARAVYGTELPVPHFYLGTNRNGDLKLRALLPISLLCGDPFRLYYTPYPSLFTTRETLQAILEDLAFGKPLRSTKTDYSGQVTPELLETEYERVQMLRNDPLSTLGLIRSVNSSDSD